MVMSPKTNRTGRKLAGAMLAAWVAAVVVLAVQPAAGARLAMWELPTPRYQAMNTFQRAQYDKAARLFREGSYKAAAAEFEKFNAQFEDSENISYMLFLRGRSLHLAKKRNTAIKVYNEVLDYFREDVAAAAPALYYKGLAYIENGDVKKGLACLREMVDSQALSKHPAAAGALGQLADHYWTHDKPEMAVRYWKQAARQFAQTNRREAAAARKNVTVYYILKADYAGYEGWLVGEDQADRAALRRTVAQNVWNVAQRGFHPYWGAYNRRKNPKQWTQTIWALHKYYTSRKAWFEKTHSHWEYYTCALSTASERLADRKETNRLVDEAAPHVAAGKDASERNGRYAWLVDRLIDVDDLFRARHFISKIADPPLAAFKEYEVVGFGEGKWQQAVARLKNIESMGDADWRAKAETTRAWVYEEKLREYEKAIKLYQQINKPPGTLWHIQECYHRWGKLKEALTTLTEIENSFPDHAARAAWRKTEYLHRAGQKKLAIATARKIMKVYPKSPESSRAHQFLERYKIATGGGLIDKD